MRNLTPHFLLAVLVGSTALTGCEFFDPDHWPDGGGGTGSGGKGGGGTGTGGGGGGGTVCAGIAGLPCPRGQFCEFELGVCSSIADATGVCKPVTEVCPAVYAPVCGCDNKTYGNDCERQAAQVSALHAGACDGGGGGDGATCGGIAGLLCSDGLYCEFEAGVCSSIADGTGICKRPPQACTDIYQPVCGCDNRTYGNDCDRQSFGVSKLHDGACRTGGEGSVCGGFGGFPCDKGLFCEEEPGVCAIVVDGTGACRPQPQICTKEYAPVCGCDRKTYGNDCERAAAGVSQLHIGPC